MPAPLPDSYLPLLATSPLFTGIAPQILLQHIPHPVHFQIRKGDHLLVPGQTTKHVYVVASGRLSLQLSESDPNPLVMYGEGDSVAEMSLLGDGHSPAFVVAATDCELIAIEHATMWKLIDHSHQAALNVLRLLSQRAELNERISADSLEQTNGYKGFDMINKLTGLYNENWMDKELGRYLKRCSFENRLSCMLLAEIDNYAQYAAKFGKLGADQELRTFAHTIISCQRPEDQAGHYAGAKILIFLPYTTNIDSARIAAERLRLAVNRADIVLPSGDLLPDITVSIGVSQLRDDGMAGLLQRAEQALLEAQASGGNCIKSAV